MFSSVNRHNNSMGVTGTFSSYTVVFPLVKVYNCTLTIMVFVVKPVLLVGYKLGEGRSPHLFTTGFPACPTVPSNRS